MFIRPYLDHEGITIICLKDASQILEKKVNEVNGTIQHTSNPETGEEDTKEGSN